MPKYACSWGYLEVDGKRFDGDVIVHVDGSITPRPIELSRHLRGQDYFHVPLSEDELGFLEAENPEVVIIGAGHRGMMIVTPKAKEILSKYVVIEAMTENAVKAMNVETRRFVAILHSKC